MDFEAYRQHMLKLKKQKEQTEVKLLSDRQQYLATLKAQEELTQREEKRKQALELSRQAKRNKTQKEGV